MISIPWNCLMRKQMYFKNRSRKRKMHMEKKTMLTHTKITVPVISKISNYFQYNKEKMCIISVLSGVS